MVPFGSLMSTTSYHKLFQTPPAVTSQKKIQIWISPPQRVHRLPRVQLTCCHSNGCCRTRGWRSNTTGQTGPRIFISTITAIAWDCSLNETMGDMFFFVGGNNISLLIGSVDSLHIWIVDILDGTCGNWQIFECSQYCSILFCSNSYYSISIYKQMVNQISCHLSMSWSTWWSSHGT